MSVEGPTLAVVGTGLMGASVALAARRAGLVGAVVGADPDPAASRAAVDVGAIDRVVTAAEAMAMADILVIGAPPRAVAGLVLVAAERADAAALIMDLASVKEPILEAVDDAFPLTHHYISVHPMAGDSRSGPAAARADLFDGAPVLLTPSVSTRPEAIERARPFWEGLGGVVHQRIPSEHDALMAGVSHLPQLLAYALAASLHGLYADPAEIRAAAGPGLAGAVRTSTSSADLWCDILASNADNVRRALGALSAQLTRLDEALASAAAGDRAALRAALDQAVRAGAAVDPSRARLEPGEPSA